MTGSGKTGGVPGISMTAQSVKVDVDTEFADVLGPEPTNIPNPTKFDAYTVGQLSLPSGRIIACDGMVMYDAIPFTRSVRPGSYPVSVAVALFGDDQRIAFAQIRFSDRRVATWEMALTAGQDESTLGPDEEFAYPVDSATGCFADPGALEVLDAWDTEKLYNMMLDEMKKVYQHTRDWLLIDTPKGSAAVFSSGEGDGRYASYFGLDENDEPVLLVTDFQVIDWIR